MNLSESAIRAVMERAVNTENGIRVKVESRGRAMNFRQRVYSVRFKDRKQSTKVYPEHHDQYGKSQFDNLVLDIIEEGGEVWVELKTARLVLEDIGLEIVDNPN